MEREDKWFKNVESVENLKKFDLDNGGSSSDWSFENPSEPNLTEDKDDDIPVLTLSEINENVIYQKLVNIEEAQRKWIQNSKTGFTGNWIKDVTDQFHNVTPRKNTQNKTNIDNKTPKASGDFTSKPTLKKTVITPSGSTFGFCNVPNLKLPQSSNASYKPAKQDKEISEYGKRVRVLKIEEPVVLRPNREKTPKKKPEKPNDSCVKKVLLSEFKKIDTPAPEVDKVNESPLSPPNFNKATNNLINKLNLEIKKVSELVEHNKNDNLVDNESTKRPQKKGKSVATKKASPEKEKKDNVVKSPSPKSKKYDLKATKNFIKQKKKEREERDIEEKKKKALENEEKKKKLLELKETQRKILQTCKRRVVNEKPQWIGPLEFLPKEKKDPRSPNRRVRGPGTVTASQMYRPEMRDYQGRQLYMDYTQENPHRIIRQNTEIIHRNIPTIDILNKGDYIEDSAHPEGVMLSTSEEISSLKTSKSESALRGSDTSYVNYAYVDYNNPPVKGDKFSPNSACSKKRNKAALSPLDPLKNVDQALKGEKRIKLNFTPDDSKVSLKLPINKFLEAIPWDNPLTDNTDRPRTPYWLKDLSEDPDPFNLINTFKRKLQMLEGEDLKEQESLKAYQKVYEQVVDKSTSPRKSETQSNAEKNFMSSVQTNVNDSIFDTKTCDIDNELLNLSADKINKYNLVTRDKFDFDTHNIGTLQTSKSDISFTSRVVGDNLKLSESLEGLNLRYQNLILGETPKQDDSKSGRSSSKSEKKKSKKKEKTKKNALVRACSEEFVSQPGDIIIHPTENKEEKCTSPSTNYATLSEFSSNQSTENKQTFQESYSYMSGFADQNSEQFPNYPPQSQYSAASYPYVYNMAPYNSYYTGNYMNVGGYVNNTNYQQMYENYGPTTLYQAMAGSFAAPAFNTSSHQMPIQTAIAQETPLHVLPVIMSKEKQKSKDKQIVQKVYAESIFSDNNSSDSISEVVQVSRTLTRGNTVINNEVHTVTSQSVKGNVENEGISEIMEVTSLRSSIHDPPFDFDENSSLDKNITYTSIETFSPNNFEERPLEMKIAKITSQVFDDIPNEARPTGPGYNSLSSYETALIKKAKACIEEMESRRLKLIGKGKDSEASILKKRERALMLKLYEDLKEIFKLRKLEKASKSKKSKEELMQVVPTQKKELTKIVPLSRGEIALRDSPEVIRSKTLELREKEEVLKERRKNVEAIVAWKQRLEQEERRVREMESFISKSPFNAPLTNFTVFPGTIDRGTSPVALEIPSIESFNRGDHIKHLCLMDSDNQNEYSDSFELSSGVSEHTMKNVTVRRHSSRMQYKKKPLTILKSPLSPRVTILKRRYSTGSDESITLSQNDTLSEQSDMEVRVSALQHQLKQRKTELEKLRKEYHKNQRERLRAKEQSLINQIQAYDSYIEQVKNELQNELEKTDIRVTKPQIKQPKYCEKKKDLKVTNSSSSEIINSVQSEQKVEVKEIKEVLESESIKSLNLQIPQQKTPVQIQSSMGSPVSEVMTIFSSNSLKESEISERLENLDLQSPELKEISENITESVQEVPENVDVHTSAKTESEVSEKIEEEESSSDTIVAEVIESIEVHNASIDSEIKTVSNIPKVFDLSLKIVNKPASIPESNTMNELKSFQTESESSFPQSPDSLNKYDEISEHISKRTTSPESDKIKIIEKLYQGSASETPTITVQTESQVDSKIKTGSEIITENKSYATQTKSISENIPENVFESLKESLSEYLPTFQTEEKSKRTMTQLLESKISEKLSNISPEDMSLESSFSVQEDIEDVESETIGVVSEKHISETEKTVTKQCSSLHPDLLNKVFETSIDKSSLDASSMSHPTNKELEEQIDHESSIKISDDEQDSEPDILDSLDEIISNSLHYEEEPENMLEISDLKGDSGDIIAEQVYQINQNNFGLTDKLWNENLEQLKKDTEETPLLSALQRERQHTLNVDYITQIICTNVVNEATDAAVAAFNRKKKFIHSQGDSLAIDAQGISIGRTNIEENNVLWNGEGLTPQAVKEAHELRMKQLKIEQEIEELEAQEVVPYYYLREIPNKPPPPYTPPKHSPPTKKETLDRVCQGVGLIWDEAIKGVDPDNIELPEHFLSNQDHPYRLFMFDLSKELYLKFKPRPEEIRPPWVVSQVPRKPLPPIRTKNDLLKYVEKEAKIVFGFEPKIQRENMIMKWSKKKRDLVDEILVKELQDEESEWTNFSIEENMVKNQIAESLIEMMMIDASQGLAAAFSKKFAREISTS